MQYFNDCMVDLETTGTDPAYAHILQIAAVRFNLEEKTIDTSEMFDRCLMPIMARRFWDEDTRAWWKGQKEGLLDSLIARSELPEIVFRDFASFLERTHCDRPLRIWAKPVSFEWPLIQSYANQLRVNLPVRHTAGRDLYTYVEAKGHDWKEFSKTVEFKGDEHNALHDVLHQIELAMRA